ncbi:major facilitator superfamily domain-containing protein 9 [Achlya hypogyna]|uniref:Major facilitator superfamily domain-containing protein 9 n=1 Tax=Achlya hypogyna TaxID=1202772 RepID=A0A1V9YQE7_ACHHY|nr:major facilitator superfamily domain-containing protein 9 [Achlya hypogyna]
MHAKAAQLRTLYLVSFLDLFAVSLIVPSLPSFIKSLGGDALTVGYVTSMYGAIQMVTSPLAGVLSDIYDRRLVLLVGIAGAAVGYVLLGMSLSLTMALFSRVPCGIFKHSLSTVRLIVADQAPRTERADAMGKINAYSSFGFIFGPLVGGYLSSRPYGFNYTAFLTAIVFVVNYALVYSALPPYLPTPPVHQPILLDEDEVAEDFEKHDAESLIAPTRTAENASLGQTFMAKLAEYNDILRESPIARNILVVRLLMAAAAILFRSHFMLLLEDKYAASSVERGYILSYMGVVAASSSYFVGPVVAWASSEAQLVLVASAVYVVSFLGTAMANALPVVLLLQVPQVVAISILRACSVSLQTAAVQPQHLGGILGLSTSLTALARTVAPMLSGYLYVVSMDGPAYGATVLAVLSCGLFWTSFFPPAHKHKKRDTMVKQAMPIRLDPVRALYVISFVDLFAVSLIVPSLPTFIKSLGGDAVTVGFVASMYGAIQMVTAPLAGVLSDIYDRRLVLLIGIAGATLGYVILGMSLTLSMALFSRIPIGIFKHTLSTVRLIVADQTTPNLRSDALGKINAYSNFGFIFGPIVGGYLSSQPGGFNVTAFLTAIMFVFNYAVVYTMLPPCPPTPPPHKPILRDEEDPAEAMEAQDATSLLAAPAPSSEQSLFRALIGKLVEYKDILNGSPKARNILLVRLLMSGASILFRSHFMLLLEEKYASSSIERGYILSYTGVLAACSSWFVGPIVAMAPSEAMLVQVTSLVCVVSFLATAVSNSLAMVLFLQIPREIGISILRACSLSLQTAAVQPQHLGGILGLSTSLTALARTIAPMLSGYLYVVSVDGPAYGATVLALMSSGLFYVSLYRTTHKHKV